MNSRLAERDYAAYSERFGPIAWIEEPEESSSVIVDGETSRHSEALRFTDEDLKPWIMKIWGVLALAAWLLDILRGLIFGPRPPRRLKSKLGRVALCAALGWILLLIAYFFGNTVYHGSFFGWFALFTGSAVVVFLISICVLALVELIKMVNAQLLKSNSGNL